MSQKIKRALIGLLCAIAAMFLWIFVAVGLTGGREAEEFTKSDKMIMTVFIVVEIATVIATMVFAVIVGNEQGKRLRQSIAASKQNGGKRDQKRGMALTAAAAALALLAMIGGVLLGRDAAAQQQRLCGWLLGISFAAGVVALLLNIVLKKWYTGRLEKQQVGQIQQFIHSHRDRAEETAARKLAFIKKWRAFTAVYALLLGLLGLCVALCAGILQQSSHATAICLTAGLLILCALSRIRFSFTQEIFEEDKSYVPQSQYPSLYAAAKKAADAMGCSGSIRIALLPNSNAGIAKVGQIYSVQLGVILLCTLSEEELYSVLLHEFAHMADRNSKAMQERDYYVWLQAGKAPHFFSGITNLFFAFFDAVYTLQFGLYEYASSIQAESAADQAMLLCGNPETVASALLKIQYYDLFEWEKGTQDSYCTYEPETPDKQLLRKELERFRQAITQHSEAWKQLLNAEIQARSASHPTVRERLEALGVKELRGVTVAAIPDCTGECEQALTYVDELICENLTEDYEANRKTYYLEPKERTEAWEKAGRPVIAQEYADTVWDLRQLGRNTEAMELCERAIKELPAAASCHAYFMRGSFRLHSYDAAGIADIYTAVEMNHNYLEEGIEAIGVFCCLTGNQKELELYRQKAVVLAQMHKDQYSQTGVLNPKDRLIEEKLPEGMLGEILAYMLSVSEGKIEKIYLVRKVITEEFFTSVFVIRFDPEAEEEVCGEIMHKIFRHLDTCSDWQFSLFDYQSVPNVPLHKIENSCVYSAAHPETLHKQH